MPSKTVCLSVFSPSQRSAEDLEVIYEELLHVKAAAHLSTSVSHLSLSAHPMIEDNYMLFRPAIELQFQEITFEMGI